MNKRMESVRQWMFTSNQFQKAYKSNLTTMSVSCAPVMELTISNLSESLIQKRQVQIYQCLECMKMNDSYFVTKWAFCFCFSLCGFSLCFDFDIWCSSCWYCTSIIHCIEVCWCILRFRFCPLTDVHVTARFCQIIDGMMYMHVFLWGCRSC